MALKSMFGDSLMKGGETVPTEQLLAGKERVGIYFSAHWCPPCRGFTPDLAKKYKELVGEGKPFEIVFASSDKTPDQFQEYFAEMPWAALPYENRDLKNKLSKKFKVQGIPTLVVVDQDGNTITTDGRSEVMGGVYPWTPKTFAEVIGDEFMSGDGDTVEYGDLEGKVLGIYFSAHWCPPCRGFTPQLVKTYKKLKEEGKNFEIIFASSDRDAGQFQEYFSEMPWLAIPQGDPRKGELSKLFGVEGIPMFVILDENRKVITTKGRGAVGSDPDGANFPWYPKAVPDLADGPDGLNDETCLLVLCEGADGKDEIEKCLEAVKKTGVGGDALFFTGKAPGDITGQIRKLCKLPDPGTEPAMILLDIPDNGGYYVSDVKEITADSVTAFLKAYADKSLTRQQLG